MHSHDILLEILVSSILNLSNPDINYLKHYGVLCFKSPIQMYVCVCVYALACVLLSVLFSSESLDSDDDDDDCPHSISYF